MPRLRRVSQPPIDRLNRPSESRRTLLGAMFVIAGLLILVAGLNARTAVPTAQGGNASEIQLIAAIRNGAVTARQPATSGPAEASPAKQKGPVVVDPTQEGDCPT